MKQTWPEFLPCPCGAFGPPRPVVDKGARKLRLVCVRCRRCGLKSPAARIDRVPVAWNLAVENRRRELAKEEVT